MYGTEGTRCPASGTPIVREDSDRAPLDRPRNRTCAACGQTLRVPADAAWPAHHLPPDDRPDRVVHRNDDADPLDARDASCTACARCDHEPDDPRCFDFCSDPTIGAWLPHEAAWACGDCTHPVVRPALKAALIGTW